MTRLLSLLFFFFLAVCPLFALEVELSHAVFKTDKGVSYVEIYTHYFAKTLTYKPLLDTRRMGAIQVVFTFQQGEKIVRTDKYLLTSPPVAAKEARENFVDQRRYMLPEGDYVLVASFTDEAEPRNFLSVSQTVTAHFDAEKVNISDIELIGKATQSTDETNPYVKSGAQIEPYVLDFYPYQVPNLKFYTEIYHTDKVLTSDFLVRYYLQQKDQTGANVTVLTANKREKAAAIVPFLGSLDLANIPSGTYDLIIEIRNLKLELIATQQKKIQRSNPYMLKTEQQLAAKTGTAELFNKLSKDSCRWSLSALFPRITGDQTAIVESIYKANDLEGMRRYLFTHWARLYPTKPQAAYREYMAIVTEIDEQYTSAAGKGHETDRGRIYLKYGKPDDILSQESEIGASPYEIWTYNKLNDHQGYVKFIFYNQSLAPNDYVLLHSNARGERNDPQWQRKLYNNAQSNDKNFIDGTDPANRNWGSNRAKSLFDE